MNYFVVSYGHIAFFEQYEPALAFKRDFNGEIFNIAGLIHGSIPDTSDIPEADENWFRNARLVRFGRFGVAV